MSFSTSVRPFGPGSIVFFSSPCLRVGISTLGATLYEVHVFHPEQKKWVQVVAHYTNYDEAYADTKTYMGATVGRFAGRISNGTFNLEGKTYFTPRNNGKHTVHGGIHAFDKKQWQYEIIDDDKCVGVRMMLRSPDGDNGFPADLDCVMTYYIPRSTPNALKSDYKAAIPKSSKADATIVNMFNHAYWNLNGLPDHDHSPDNTKEGVWTVRPESVHNHIVRMPRASLMAETDDQAIPSGRLITPPPVLDFRRGLRIGDHIDDPIMNRNPRGYDHPYAIDGWKPSSKRELYNAQVTSPSTNITMNIYSNFPCLWVYTANNMKKDISGACGERHARHESICMEPQFLPDAVNKKSFYCAVARKGKPYHYSMTNVFAVGKADHKL